MAVRFRIVFATVGCAALSWGSTPADLRSCGLPDGDACKVGDHSLLQVTSQAHRASQAAALGSRRVYQKMQPVDEELPTGRWLSDGESLVSENESEEKATVGGRGHGRGRGRGVKFFYDNDKVNILKTKNIQVQRSAVIRRKEVVGGKWDLQFGSEGMLVENPGETEFGSVGEVVVGFPSHEGGQPMFVKVNVRDICHVDEYAAMSKKCCFFYNSCFRRDGQLTCQRVQGQWNDNCAAAVDRRRPAYRVDCVAGREEHGVGVRSNSREFIRKQKEQRRNRWLNDCEAVGEDANHYGTRSPNYGEQAQITPPGKDGQCDADMWSWFSFDGENGKALQNFQEMVQPPPTDTDILDRYLGGFALQNFQKTIEEKATPISQDIDWREFQKGVLVSSMTTQHGLKFGQTGRCMGPMTDRGLVKVEFKFDGHRKAVELNSMVICKKEEYAGREKRCCFLYNNCFSYEGVETCQRIKGRWSDDCKASAHGRRVHCVVGNGNGDCETEFPKDHNRFGFRSPEYSDVPQWVWPGEDGQCDDGMGSWFKFRKKSGKMLKDQRGKVHPTEDDIEYAVYGQTFVDWVRETRGRQEKEKNKKARLVAKRFTCQEDGSCGPDGIKHATGNAYLPWVKIGKGGMFYSYRIHFTCTEPLSVCFIDQCNDYYYKTCSTAGDEPNVDYNSESPLIKKIYVYLESTGDKNNCDEGLKRIC